MLMARIGPFLGRGLFVCALYRLVSKKKIVFSLYSLIYFSIQMVYNCYT